MTGPEIIAWIGSRSPGHWLGRSREPHVVARRYLAGWLLREVRVLPMSEIARLIGLERTTLARGLRRIDQMAQENPVIAYELHRVASIARGRVVSMERARA